jgi:nucleoside-diphosphate-sugar epimerase
MDKVFVTGANGLLGTNLVVVLLEQGFSVVALVRKRKSFQLPVDSRIELVEGSLEDVDFLERKIKECRYVVHVAANTSQKLLKLKDYYPANVEGTRNVVDACLRCNVHKLVYVSTANIFGFGSKENPGNEDTPMRFPFTGSLYAMSKKEAQDVVDEASGELNITTVCPAFMLGAYDAKPGSGRIVQRALDKRVVFYPPGGKSFVHVRDVALSIVKAFDLKDSGDMIILCNENVTYREFYKKLLILSKQKSILIPVPAFLLKLVGLVGDMLRRAGWETELSSANMAALCVRNYYSNLKARELFGIRFSPLEEVLAETLKYFLKR